MDKRKLSDLVSVGKATIADFDLLGLHSVGGLVGKDAKRLVTRLEQILKSKLDPCCEDVFHAAIAQAEDPTLEREKCNWYYWSKVRKNKF